MSSSSFELHIFYILNISERITTDTSWHKLLDHVMNLLLVGDYGAAACCCVQADSCHMAINQTQILFVFPLNH